MYPDIFSIQKSKMDMKFIEENGGLGLEIAFNIIDELTNLPILGNFFKCVKLVLILKTGIL